MKSKTKLGLWDLLLVVIGLIPLIIAIIFYSRLPLQMVTHYGFNGEANGYMKKEFAILLMGVMSIGIPFFIKFTRYIDPKRNNYLKFEDTFELIRLFVSILFSGVFIFTIFYNLGYTFSMRYWGFPILGIFFIFMGNILGRIRYNYFIGIRTPWTLSNEEVWRRTHRFGGPIFIIAGILLILSLIFDNPFWVVLASLILLVVVPTGYSYIISRQINQN